MDKQMIKIVATINDAGMATHVGGPVESISEIVEVPTNNIPPNLKRFIEERKDAKAKNKWIYQTVSLSLLDV